MNGGAAATSSSRSKVQEFILNADGTILVDHKGKPVSVERFLSTKPLRAEVSTRKGPGGMKLSYMGGETVIKTLNDAFGHDGWSLEVKNTTREEPIKDDKGRYHVAYIATVRITLRRSGVFREDCGAGDSIDRSLASASGNALKGAITDAMKRAARHFGEKLGNGLYHDGFNANNAPSTLKDALDTLDIDRAKSRFGFDKDRKKVAAQNTVVKTSTQNNNQLTNRNSASNQVATTVVKTETMTASSNQVSNTTTKSPHAQQTPRTQYVGNVVMEHSNMANQKMKANLNNAKPSVTPYHAGAGNNTARNTSAAAASVISNPQSVPKSSTSYVTSGNRAAATSKSSTTLDLSAFAAVPASKMGNNGKENTNPQSAPPKVAGGLALPPRLGTSGGPTTRPGTSRGAALPGESSPTSAYIANFADGGSAGTPSMFGANGSMSQALAMEQGLFNDVGGQSLKRKSDAIVGTSAAAKSAKNPYAC